MLWTSTSIFLQSANKWKSDKKGASRIQEWQSILQEDFVDIRALSVLAENVADKLNEESVDGRHSLSINYKSNSSGECRNDESKAHSWLPCTYVLLIAPKVLCVHL